MISFDHKAYKQRAAQRRKGKIVVQKTKIWKPGYRKLSARMQDHRDGKAIQFRYFSWLIWLPAKAIWQMQDGSYITSWFMIVQAKDHASAIRLADE